MYRITALAAVLTALPAIALAQAAPSPSPTASPSIGKPLSGNNCASLTTLINRPTITQTSCTVPRNRVLVEGGYQNTTATGGPSGTTNAVTYPNAEIRIGTSLRNVEFDVALPTYNRFYSGSSQITGGSDIGFGGNVQLTQKVLPVRASVSGFVTSPAGSPAFGSAGGNYIGNLNLGGSLGRFALDGTLSWRSLSGFTGPTTAQGFGIVGNGATPYRYGSFVPSAVVSTQFGRLIGPSPGSVFFEAARFSRTSSYGDARMFYQAGYKQAISGRGAVDVEYGSGPRFGPFSTFERSLGAGASFLF